MAHGEGKGDTNVTYQNKTGTLSQGAHPGSYNGQDAYNDMLITEGGAGESLDNRERSTDHVTSDYKVRRLTPKECARLQGFPPDWCDGIPHTDSAEYKLWGNGIALPCLLPMLKAMKERGCETLGNFFSGSGAWELAGQIVGLKPVYESEIEAFPVRLEAERFPECIQLGDITKVNPEDVPYVDVLSNSSPCQNLSNAGNRKGLKGEQSELFTDVIRVTRGLRDLGRLPRFWCWENVPGALSCSRGEDFRIVLQEIARVVQEDAVIPLPPKGKWLTAGVVDGDNWQIAWRVMDSQFFGVAQRRRRIFLVADFRGHSATEVLFEREGVSWNFAESISSWENTELGLGERIGRASKSVMGSLRRHESEVGRGEVIPEREQ